MKQPTKDMLRDQLALAADEIIRQREGFVRIIEMCERTTFMERLRHRLARWVRGWL